MVSSTLAMTTTSASGAGSAGGSGSSGTNNSTGSSLAGQLVSSLNTPQVQTIQVGATPDFVTNDSGNGYVYVPNYNSTTVSVFAGTTATTVTAGSKPFFATYDPNNGFVYVTNEGTTSNGTGSVTVINGTTVPRGGTIYVGPNPYFGLFDPRNGYVYIPAYGGHNVYVLYGLSIVENIPTKNGPISATYDARHNYVDIMDLTAGYVTIMCNGSYVTNISLGASSEPIGAAFDSGNGYVYVADLGAGAVTILNGTSIVGNITGLGSPHSAVYDPSNGYVYVPNGRYSVAVITGTSLVKSVNTGTPSQSSVPLFAAYNPVNRQIYVANSYAANVTIINGTTTVSNVSLAAGTNPHSATYDPGNGNVFIPSGPGAATVSMIGPGPTVAPCVSVTHVSVTIQGGYQYAVVSWTDPSLSSTTFKWGSTTGFGTSYGLAVPTYTNSSYTYTVNLNDLSSATAYQFVVSLATACSGRSTPGAVVGAFQTSQVQVNGFPGWVANQTLSKYALDPVGLPVKGATVGISVVCHSTFGYPTVYFTGPKTSATGAYTLTLPLYNNSTQNEQFILTLTPLYGYNGPGCAYNGYDDFYFNSLSQFTLVASYKGEWNITRNVSANSPIAANERFQQFVLPPNELSNEPAAWHSSTRPTVTRITRMWSAAPSSPKGPRRARSRKRLRP